MFAFAALDTPYPTNTPPSVMLSVAMLVLAVVLFFWLRRRGK